MSDEKEEAKIDATEDSGAGDKYETTPVIERARETSERMEAANKKREELLDREEAMMAKKELGGGSEGGKEDKPHEETAKEYADRIMKNE